MTAAPYKLKDILNPEQIEAIKSIENVPTKPLTWKELDAFAFQARGAYMQKFVFEKTEDLVVDREADRTLQIALITLEARIKEIQSDGTHRIKISDILSDDEIDYLSQRVEVVPYSFLDYDELFGFAHSSVGHEGMEMVYVAEENHDGDLKKEGERLLKIGNKLEKYRME